ncbi:MAG: 2-C-methyl-D-erythritol 2,4-cyclodiphosphate synthase [Anaplasma sp.]
MPFRVGVGYDVHRFSEEPVQDGYIVVCGVKIAHQRRVIAHSDGDVGLHALVDALLGCVGEGSVGQHFPNTDPAWAGVASTHFLAEAHKKVRARGYAVINCDISIVCEAPKIVPHVAGMKSCMSQILGINLSAINVKAVTTEKLGFIGREEGIAAHAVALCQGITPN